MNITVLIIDDSALVRQSISEILSKGDDIRVITAHDPLFAVEKIKKNKIDVITLDIEMPRMDGLTFLKKLMNAKPIPTIVISSLTQKNAEITLEALELGAFDVILKPDGPQQITDLAPTLLAKIKQAAHTSVTAKLKHTFDRSDQRNSIIPPKKPFTKSIHTTDKIIAVGSSTGGTVAIAEVLKTLPVGLPGIIIVQHMPEKFTSSFAERLNDTLELSVKEAEDGDQIKSGFVYVAPGGRHCSVKASGAKYHVVLKDGPPINYHKPSVAALFDSVAKFVGKNAIGVMLTGMGEDGAKAMKSMRDNGSYNIVQDQATSIVWGMPGKAFEYGAADIVLPLRAIGQEITKRCGADE